MNCQLIKVEEGELNNVAKLAHEIWYEHYVPIIGKNQVDYMLDKMYSYDALTEQVNAKGHQLYFIELDHQKVGFVSLEHLKNQNTVFIHKFYILSGKQKSGLGTQVFTLIQGLFPEKVSYKLTVNRQNYKSINFYFKNGFVIEQVADFDIGEGYVMNDFVMTRHRTQDTGHKK